MREKNLTILYNKNKMRIKFIKIIIIIMVSFKIDSKLVYKQVNEFLKGLYFLLSIDDSWCIFKIKQKKIPQTITNYNKLINGPFFLSFKTKITTKKGEKKEVENMAFTVHTELCMHRSIADNPAAAAISKRLPQIVRLRCGISPFPISQIIMTKGWVQV